MNVILDTNILHQEGLHSGSMKMLLKIVKSTNVRVLIPEIVKREFITKRVFDAKDSFRTIKGVLFDLRKKMQQGSEMSNSVESVDNAILDIEEKIKNGFADEFDLWCIENDVEVLNFNNELFSSVLDDYFSGEGAFKHPKRRDDIPDSIISHSVLEFLKDNDNVVVVVKDGVLKNHLSKVVGLKVFDTLKEFLDSPKMVELLSEIEQENNNAEILKRIFSNEYFHNNLLENFRENLKKSYGVFQRIYVEESGVGGVGELKLDTFGVSINGIVPDIDEIKFGKVAYLYPGAMAVGVSMIGISDLHYCSDYVNYMALPAERRELLDLTSMDGRGIVDISERRKVRIDGYLEFYFEQDMASEDLEKILLNDDFIDSSIKVDFNVTYAEIVN